MKILIYCPQPNDATSFYRAYGVFAFLPGVQLVPFHGEQNTWADLIDIDLAFFQRPYLPQIVQTMEYLKRMKKPIWIDFDDDFMNVPAILNTRWKPSLESREAIKRMCQLADMVTVSTEHLKKIYGQAEVIPNAINDYLLDMTPRIGTKKRILWRGSASHQADSYAYKEPIEYIIKKYPEWQFVWYGMKPIWTDEGIHIYGTDLFYYFDKLLEVSAKIAIVPLIDSDFNHSKSNISELEMAWSGSRVLVPDWEEWISGDRYSDLYTFKIQLETMINEYEPMPVRLPLLSEVNKLRNNLINKLI